MQTKRQKTEQRSRIRQRLAGAAVLFLFCGFSYSSYASMDVRHRNGSSQIPVLKSRYFPFWLQSFWKSTKFRIFHSAGFLFYWSGSRQSEKETNTKHALNNTEADEQL